MMSGGALRREMGYAPHESQDHDPSPPGTAIVRWAVGVTALPESGAHLEDCLRSIQRAGWERPRIFAGADVQLGALSRRQPRSILHPGLGELATHVVALAELLMREPYADAFLLIQADCILYGEASLREYLEASLWPDRNVGAVSLCGPPVEPDTTAGWQLATRPWDRGLAAWVFPRQSVLGFVSDSRILDQAASGDSTVAASALGDWARRQGRSLFFPTAGLASRAAASGSPDPARAVERTILAALTQRGQAITGKVPISVVIPVRNRAGTRLKNCLSSLRWQCKVVPQEVLVVSFGSSSDTDLELATLCSEAGARLVCTGNPDVVWSWSFPANVGIRATSPDSRFVMLLDADMILAPNFFDVLTNELEHDPDSMVLCQSSDLGQDVLLSEDPDALRKAFSRLWSGSRLRGPKGCGGIQVAPRKFFFDVHGLDEDFKFWGGEDRDMVQRAERYGLTIRWITRSTSMLHQHHPRELDAIQDPARKAAARQAMEANYRLLRERETLVERNPDGWGGMDP